MKLVKGKFPYVDCERWPNGQDSARPMRIRRDEDPHATHLGPDGIVQVPVGDPLLQMRQVPITARRQPRTRAYLERTEHLRSNSQELGRIVEEGTHREDTRSTPRGPHTQADERDIAEKDHAEAALLNNQGRRVSGRSDATTSPHDQPHIQINTARAAPRTSAGRLAGAGYEATDTDVGDSNRHVSNTDQDSTISTRARLRLIHADPDELEARELNAR